MFMRSDGAPRGAKGQSVFMRSVGGALSYMIFGTLNWNAFTCGGALSYMIFGTLNWNAFTGARSAARSAR